MKYRSTRGYEQAVSSAEAIVQGLAPDGGLFVPESFPQWTLEQISQLEGLPFHAVSARVLSGYLTDFSSDELDDITQKAYGKQFTASNTLPLYSLSTKESVLELFHGPTLAFKDVALQILPHLLKASMKKTNEQKKMLILVATSGDTGKAALDGFANVDDTAIAVFYPEDGVSSAQKLQMQTQEGDNVYVCAVDGNFDDTQTGVKRIFSDASMKKTFEDAGYRLSSANSINWGRLVPQIAYYFWSYIQLVADKKITLGEEINFVVPTGNFGNILAGYYAKKMGLPVHKFVCASNRNNVLSEFFADGKYDRNRDFYKTTSPSMDILISSNLERLLYEISDRDGQQVAQWMQSLQETGTYNISDSQYEKIQHEFFADWCDDKQAAQAIATTFKTKDYLMDTHTGIAQYIYQKYLNATNDTTHTVIVSTASPYKFAADVLHALDSTATISNDSFVVCDTLAAKTHTTVPNAITELKSKPVRFTQVCAPLEMEQILVNEIKNK